MNNIKQQQLVFKEQSQALPPRASHALMQFNPHSNPMRQVGAFIYTWIFLCGNWGTKTKYLVADLDLGFVPAVQLHACNCHSTLIFQTFKTVYGDSFWRPFTSLASIYPKFRVALQWLVSLIICFWPLFSARSWQSHPFLSIWP